MPLYKDLFESFVKRYAGECSKQEIQVKCNKYWREIKEQFKGDELKEAINQKISDLNSEAKRKKISLHRFFVQVIQVIFFE